MVYNGYYKVMSNIPKMGQLPTPELWWPLREKWPIRVLSDDFTEREVENHQLVILNLSHEPWAIASGYLT